MAKGITISSDKKSLRPAEVAALYRELGWGTAARYFPARMKRSLAKCDIVVGARNEAGELIGIARALSDFALETKILDMIVAPEYQRAGVGRAIMREIERRARGTAIYCETERKNFGFVARCGYVRRKGLTVFVKNGVGKSDADESAKKIFEICPLIEKISANRYSNSVPIALVVQRIGR